MTKQEVISFMKKVKAYYPYFSIDDEQIMDEWAKRLEPYSESDVHKKLDEHLFGEYGKELPKLHYLTRYLKTEEEKEKMKHDHLIRCNLCGQEMFLKEYEETHFKKCLLIRALIPVLKKKGEEVTIEDLQKYEYETLEKVWDKYVPLKKDIKI